MRQKNNKRTNGTAIVLGLLFLLAGVLGSVLAWGAYWKDTSIQRNGARAEGHITKKIKLFSADGDSDFIVEYWFDRPNGTRIEASRGVGKSLWDSFHEGETLVVLYSPDDPKRNFPLGAGVTSFGVIAFASGIGLVFAVFGAFLIIGAVSKEKSVG